MDEKEMMSQDTAFEVTKPEDVFKFDDENATPAEPVGTEDEVEEKEEPETPAEPVGTEDEGQKVPYSRFKKKLDELTETTSRMQFLEERLQELEKARQEPANEDIELPEEWVKLYGDSDVAKEAFKVQLKREDQIAERAIRQAMERIESKQKEEVERLSENETIIEENLASLSETLGKKLTSKQEEEILSIVDEFSPVGEDGKYITLFPFNKAYEIYTLRNTVKTAPTIKARNAVADLTRDSSNSEPDPSNNHYDRSWDGWTKAL